MTPDQIADDVPTISPAGRQAVDGMLSARNPGEFTRHLSVYFLAEHRGHEARWLSERALALPDESAWLDG